MAAQDVYEEKDRIEHHDGYALSTAFYDVVQD